MIYIHIDPGACLEIHDVKQTSSFFVFPDNQHIRRSKSGRCNVTVIYPFLHKHQRLGTVALHLLDDGDDELRISVCNGFNLFCIKLF